MNVDLNFLVQELLLIKIKLKCMYSCNSVQYVQIINYYARYSLNFILTLIMYIYINMY